MDRGKTKNEIDEFDAAYAEVMADGMPSWSERTLKTEFVEELNVSPGVDKPFLLITILLLIIGLIMVLSASFSTARYMMGESLHFFIRQGVFAVSGIAIMLLVSRFSVRTIRGLSIYVLLISIALLVLVLAFGTRINGATRWLAVGREGTTGFSFQPSEIAKIAIILAFAQMASNFGRKRMKTFKYGVIPFVAITAVIALLLWRQPHVSAVIIIATTAIVMMFAGGTSIRYFVMGLIAAVLVAALLILPALFTPSRVEEAVSSETQVTQIDFGAMGHWGRRIDTWLNPDDDPLGAGFQMRQSLNAVGSGGWLGQGLGQSRQKHQYLPEEHNDFIFAIIAEELGFVGAMLILSLFALLVVRGFWLALHAKDRFSALIVIGISSLLAIQVFFNVAVVIGAIPATGIPLPLFSYGGTALWIQLAQMGIVLAVSREIPLIKQEAVEEEIPA